MCSGHFRRHAHVLQHLFRPNHQTILLFFTIPAHRFQLTSYNRHTKHPKLPCPYLEDYPIRKWVTHGIKKLNLPGTVLQSQADLVFTDDLQQTTCSRCRLPRGMAIASFWSGWRCPDLEKRLGLRGISDGFNGFCVFGLGRTFLGCFFWGVPKEKGEQCHPKNNDGWWLCRLHGWVSIHQSSLWVLDRLGHRPWIPSCR